MWPGPGVLFDDSLPHSLPKNADLWQNAAMSVEENPLSKREQEILTLVARGLSNQEIAKDLVISQNTVKVHLRNIFAKLEAVSRTDAVVKAAQAGWVEVGGLEEETGDSPVATEALPSQPPLARWQRVYFFLAAALVLAALLVPGLLSRLEARAPVSDMSDAGLPRLGAPARVDVARWSSLAPLPQPRSRLALTAVDDLLVAIGGEGPNGVVDAVDVYDPETNGWLPRSAKPLPVANVQAADPGHSPPAGRRPGRGLRGVSGRNARPNRPPLAHRRRRDGRRRVGRLSRYLPERARDFGCGCGRRHAGCRHLPGRHSFDGG